MRLGKKLKIPLVLLILISFSTQSLAQIPPQQKGKYTSLKQGEPAPFQAWCFDDVAAGTIFSALQHAKSVCDLEIRKQLGMQKAKFDLDIGKLNIRYDTLKKQNDALLLIKDEEIRKLEKAALKRPNEYWHWWALGGFSAGVVTAAAIFLSIE
mgnify:CR=1 FL=1|tara:strand:- start:772 stop:1230 length:459 start_codon:yes stop_codon:yes gene_type:complete